MFLDKRGVLTLNEDIILVSKVNEVIDNVVELAKTKRKERNTLVEFQVIEFIANYLKLSRNKTTLKTFKEKAFVEFIFEGSNIKRHYLR